MEGYHSTNLFDRISYTVFCAKLRNEYGEEVNIADTINNPLYGQRFDLVGCEEGV